MTTECIHGLELSRCDVCSPKVVPKSAVAARPAARVRSARPAPGRPANRSATQAAGRRPVNLAEQRIHHVTHLSNLTGILEAGALFADASSAWDARPSLDMSSADNRALRRSTRVVGGGTVADFVPFYLSPDALLWQAVRAGSRDPRLSAAARSLPASEFVVLVSTVAKAAAARAGEVVVTDRDAADPRARRAGADYEALLRRLIADRQTDALLGAEFLVRDSVPLESFSLIGVANEKARSRVRELLGSSEYQPRVAVHPPWFAVPEPE